jgi:hypothetical protein
MLGCQDFKPKSPGSHSPKRSMVSLILLAAFSLSSPGWLLLMENKVMTPEQKGTSDISRGEAALLGGWVVGGRVQ